MTYIQPHTQTNPFNKLVVICLALTLCAIVALVMLYNTTVDIRHGISELKTDLQEIESQNAETKDSIFSMLDTAALHEFASARGLVNDKNPTYLSLDQQWVAASY